MPLELCTLQHFTCSVVHTYIMFRLEVMSTLDIQIGNFKIGNFKIGNVQIGNAKIRIVQIRNIKIGNVEIRNWISSILP